MKKYKSNLFKLVLWVSLSLFFVGFAVFLYFFVPSLNIKLDVEKLHDDNVAVEIFSADGKMLDKQSFADEYVTFDKIPAHVKNSFVCLEDKRFFDHNGIDFFRIAGALCENIKNMRFKEGASTITQQLIKNTHLSNEKTLTRKFAEIRLALQLEKEISKEKILEVYLNSIYFGNNCFGIAQASRYYFDKDVQQLSLAQSATLAGMISAPNAYSPDKNMAKCIERRNLALKVMLDNGKILQQEYQNATNEQIDVAKIGIKNDNNKSYAYMTICEVADIFGITPSQVKHLDLKIHTFLDEEKQKALADSVKNQNIKTQNKKNAQKMAISVDNDTCGVEAFFANTNQDVYSLKRQIGSTAKPIVCLAPSFEQNLITPSTFLLDEKTDFGGYRPSNSSDKYDGWITVRQAIAKSKNVPAVKLLNALNKQKLKDNLHDIWGWQKDFDVNLNMALGSFEQGLTLMQLADSYLTLANDGFVQKCSFVSKIEDKNGNVLYQNNHIKNKTFREDTAFLTTQVLKDVAKYGTARNLSPDFDLAGKTGTVGKKGCKNNSDALFCSYTSTDTTVFWVFADYDDLLQSGVTGSGAPVDMAKDFYSKIYKIQKPRDFVQPSSVVKTKLDKVLLNQGKIAIANGKIPQNEVVEEYFSVYNLPKQISDRCCPMQKVAPPTEKNFFDELLIDFERLKIG